MDYLRLSAIQNSRRNMSSQFTEAGQGKGESYMDKSQKGEYHLQERPIRSVVRYAKKKHSSFLDSVSFTSISRRRHQHSRSTQWSVYYYARIYSRYYSRSLRSFFLLIGLQLLNINNLSPMPLRHNILSLRPLQNLHPMRQTPQRSKHP